MGLQPSTGTKVRDGHAPVVAEGHRYILLTTYYLLLTTTYYYLLLLTTTYYCHVPVVAEGHRLRQGAIDDARVAW